MDDNQDIYLNDNAGSIFWGSDRYIFVESEQETWQSTDHNENLDVMKSYISDYDETKVLQKQNDVLSSTSFADSLGEEYRTAIDANNKDILFNDEVCMPELFQPTADGIFLNDTNEPKITGSTVGCDFSSGLKDVSMQDIRQNHEEPRKEILPGANASENKKSEFCKREELLPTNEKCAVAEPSSTTVDAQLGLVDGRFVRKHVAVHYRTSTGEKTFPCNKCSKTFSNPKRLALHCFTHTSEKPFSCTECIKTFSHPNSLTRHRRSHTYSFSCDKCTKAYTSSRKLAMHCRTHTKEILYKCSICDIAYWYKSSLRQHNKKVHNIV